jgi:hypothetical protein
MFWEGLDWERRSLEQLEWVELHSGFLRPVLAAQVVATIQQNK